MNLVVAFTVLCAAFSHTRAAISCHVCTFKDIWCRDPFVEIKDNKKYCPYASSCEKYVESNGGATVGYRACGPDYRVKETCTQLMVANVMTTRCYCPGSYCNAAVRQSSWLALQAALVCSAATATLAAYYRQI